MRILAVDDEPFILELMPMLAARVGFSDLVTAASGAEALERVASAAERFDCFVLDINMPGMDGIELCGRIRALDGFRHTPIIMLTAMSERDFMDAAFKAGATDYTTKPFDIHEFGARLRVAQESVKARAAELAVARSAEQSGPGHSFAPGDRITLDGVETLVDYPAFCNYLRQLSRAGLSSCQLMAVCVTPFDMLYARASDDEVRHALRDVGHALHATLRARGCLMSYAGAGLFVIVSNSTCPLDHAQIESDTQALLDEAEMTYDDGTPLDLDLSVGARIQPIGGDPADAMIALDRAVARATGRLMAKRDAPRAVSIRHLRP